MSIMYNRDIALFNLQVTKNKSKNNRKIVNNNTYIQLNDYFDRMTATLIFSIL